MSGVHGADGKSIPLFSAFGVVAPEQFTEETLIDAVIAFANGDATPEGPSERVEGARKFARDMLSAAAASIKRVDLEDGRTGMTGGASVLMNWIALNGAVAHQISAQLGFKLVTSRRADLGSEIYWRLTGPNEAKPWIAFAGMLIKQRADGLRTEIGHCQYQICGRHFRVLIRGRGKPARDYCPKTDHRSKAQPLSTPRANKSRENKRKRLEEAKRVSRRRHK